MFKLLKTCIFCLLAAFLVWFGTVLADRQVLNDNVIRFHVVANADSEEDQAVKLQIRATVMDYLEPIIGEQKNMPKNVWARDTQKIAFAAMKELGMQIPSAHLGVGFGPFTMPAGTYDALRITVGEGQGQNWWCVVFPQLCLPAVSEDFEDTAAGAGFSDSLTGALEGEYQVRFFLLDCLGWLENFFFGS